MNMELVQVKIKAGTHAPLNSSGLNWGYLALPDITVHVLESEKSHFKKFYPSAKGGSSKIILFGKIYVLPGIRNKKLNLIESMSSFHKRVLKIIDFEVLVFSDWPVA